MIIKFKLERDDTNRLGEVIHEDGVWKFRHDVDWDDVESVARLTRWRTSLFGRLLGPIRDTRFGWLESERDELFDIVQKHLLTMNGQWSRIDWELVASAYNRSLAGSTQRARERGAERRYDFKIKGKKFGNISKGKPLAKDCKAPIRKAKAIRYQIQNFTHPLAHQIIEQAKKADQDSGTDATNHNPDSQGYSDVDEVGAEEDVGNGEEEGNGVIGERSDEFVDEDPDATEDEVQESEEEAERVRIAAKEAEMEEERRAAHARYAEEERQTALLTNPRQIVKDLAVMHFMKGG